MAITRIPPGITPASLAELIRQDAEIADMTVSDLITALKDFAGTSFTCLECDGEGRYKVNEDDPDGTEKACGTCGGFGFTMYEMEYSCEQQLYVIKNPEDLPDGGGTPSPGGG